MYFPFMILSAIILLLILGSYLAISETRIITAAVALLAPIEVMALICQCYLASKKQQVNCIDFTSQKI